jgi:hypothetical protein
LKRTSLLFVLLTLISCREEEGIWDKLTPAEQAALLARSQTKCLANAATDILDITDTSNTEMLNLARLDTWKLEYKKDSALIETSNVYVWKVDGSTVYFLFSLIEGGSTSNKFVKMTNVTNSELFEDLRQKKCTSGLELSVSRTLLSAVIEEGEVTIDADTYYKFKATHSFHDELPAFFGFFNKKREKSIYNTSNDTVKSSEKYEYIITRITDVTSLSTDFTNNSTYPNKTYCVADYTAGTPNVYPLANALNYALECSLDVNVGPDPDGDTIPNFAPATELVI